MSTSISDLQFDTSLVPIKNTVLRLQSQRAQKPFTGLIDFIESAFLPVQIPLYGLEKNAHYLNHLCNLLHNPAPITFVPQEVYDGDKRYYEQIIFETKNVPTRPNWHDFFNGLIWSQFPQTKHYFNSQHIAEITLQGSAQRTPVRDRLTHFDECGIVLFTAQKHVATQVQNHKWDDLFVKNSANWHQQTLAVIFGHALWEMLLEPFIGLTAKATVIEVPEEMMLDLKASENTAEFYIMCDNLLSEHIKINQLISKKKPWLPLPMLGIPDWSPFPQTPTFYSNTQYFMPKNK